MTPMKARPTREVSTAAVTALGLIGGWLSARESGVRPLGGVLLGSAWLWSARTWKVRDGLPATVALSALYAAAFVIAHPLSKRIGPWPAVLTLTAAASGAAWVVSDRTA